MRSIRIFALFPLLLFTIAALRISAGAQTADTINDWETLRPEGEEFGILMPKNSTSQNGPEQYHKMTLNTRLYLWVNPAGPVFAVASISGIKANPALYSEMERVNSYVDAFKQWFPPKVRGKDAVAKLTLIGEKKLNGHSGREYRFITGDLSGIVNVYATRKRFYAVVALNTKKDEALSDRFLSSFTLPQKLEPPPPTVALKKETPEEPETLPNAQSQKAEARPKGAEGSTETPTETKPTEAAPQTDQPAKREPISGGVLNGKAITLPVPEYPAEARAARASGAVVVQVTIDEYGNVMVAKAVSGHPLLQQSAVNAARQAKFSPTFLMGEAVKVTGVLTFNFAAH